MENTETQTPAQSATPATPDWSCNTCGQTEGVENGICPKCGPTQTTPLSQAAKDEAGVVEEKEEEETEPADAPSGSETK